MKILDANSWEDYSDYAAKKVAKAKRAEKKRITKKEKQKKLKDQNSTMKGMAKHYAKEMQNEPSALEKRMQEFLDSHGVVYQFQKPLYIKKKNSSIRKFYIADFYIPAINLIIETDGKFHEEQVKQDERRTKDIQKHYPGMKILRWKWYDFESLQKIKSLVKLLNLSKIRQSEGPECL